MALRQVVPFLIRSERGFFADNVNERLAILTDPRDIREVFRRGGYLLHADEVFFSMKCEPA